MTEPTYEHDVYWYYVVDTSNNEYLPDLIRIAKVDGTPEVWIKYAIYVRNISNLRASTWESVWQDDTESCQRVLP